MRRAALRRPQEPCATEHKRLRRLRWGAISTQCLPSQSAPQTLAASTPQVTDRTPIPRTLAFKAVCIDLIQAWETRGDRSASAPVGDRADDGGRGAAGDGADRE